MKLVFETAPMQVVDRAEELGLVKVASPGARRLLPAATHVAYGVGTGTAFGLLCKERSVPLTGVNSPPWEQQTPKVLLPALDHAVYGAAWGLAYWALTRKQT